MKQMIIRKWDTYRGHETQRAIALSHNIRLNVTVVILAGPNETAARLETLGDHIVNETMFVPDLRFLEVGLVSPARAIKDRPFISDQYQDTESEPDQSCGKRSNVLFVDFLENVLEATIVALQDRVLGGHVQRPFLGQRHLEDNCADFSFILDLFIIKHWKVRN